MIPAAPGTRSLYRIERSAMGSPPAYAQSQNSRGFALVGCMSSSGHIHCEGPLFEGFGCKKHALVKSRLDQIGGCTGPDLDAK
jgi:hypothetical protein